MNWGLFLALALFLLPLSLIVRTFFDMVSADRPIGDPGQILRISVILFLGVPVIGKTPTMLYSTIGGWDELGTLTQAFMATPWGSLQASVMLTAVIVYDLLVPKVFAAIDPDHCATPVQRRRYLLRDAGIIAICFVCACAVAALRP